MDKERDKRPDCGQYTTPEEISFLSKYLKKKRQEFEERIEFQEDVLAPEVDVDPEAKLDDTLEELLPNYGGDPDGLDRTIIRGDFDTDTPLDNTKIKLGDYKETSFLDKTKEKIPQTQNEIHPGETSELDRHVEGLDLKETKVELDNTLLWLDDSYKDVPLDRTILNLDVPKSDDYLDSTTISLDVPKGGDKLDNTVDRLDFSPIVKLDNTVDKLEPKLEGDTLDEYVDRIGDFQKNNQLDFTKITLDAEINEKLDDTKLDLSLPYTDVGLDSTVVSLDREYENVKLDSTVLDLESPYKPVKLDDHVDPVDGPKDVPLNDYKPRTPSPLEVALTKKIEGLSVEFSDVKLDDTVINPEKSPECVDLSNETIRLDIPIEDSKLDDTRLTVPNAIGNGEGELNFGGELSYFVSTIDNPYSDVELDKTRLDLVTPYKDVDLDKTRLDLNNPYSDVELDKTRLDLVTPYKDVDLDKTRLDLNNPYSDVELDKTRLDLVTPYKDVELDKTRLDLEVSDPIRDLPEWDVNNLMASSLDRLLGKKIIGLEKPDTEVGLDSTKLKAPGIENSPEEYKKLQEYLGLDDIEDVIEFKYTIDQLAQMGNAGKKIASYIGAILGRTGKFSRTVPQEDIDKLKDMLLSSIRIELPNKDKLDPERFENVRHNLTTKNTAFIKPPVDPNLNSLEKLSDVKLTPTELEELNSWERSKSFGYVEPGIHHTNPDLDIKHKNGILNFIPNTILDIKESKSAISGSIPMARARQFIEDKVTRALRGREKTQLVNGLMYAIQEVRTFRELQLGISPSNLPGLRPEVDRPSLFNDLEEENYIKTLSPEEKSKYFEEKEKKKREAIAKRKAAAKLARKSNNSPSNIGALALAGGAVLGAAAVGTVLMAKSAINTVKAYKNAGLLSPQTIVLAALDSGVALTKKIHEFDQPQNRPHPTMGRDVFTNVGGGLNRLTVWDDGSTFLGKNKRSGVDIIREEIDLTSWEKNLVDVVGEPKETNYKGKTVVSSPKNNLDDGNPNFVGPRKPGVVDDFKGDLTPPPIDFTPPIYTEEVDVSDLDEKLAKTKSQSATETQSTSTSATNITPKEVPDGLLLTLEDLCGVYGPNDEDLGSYEKFKSIILSSPYMTNPAKFTGTSKSNVITTLDSNHIWEVILEPYIGSLNGNMTWLPPINEINTINYLKHGVETYWSQYLPVLSFDLTSKRLSTRSLPLFDGEVVYPVSMEYTNELSLTIMDDQFKSLKTYFDKCADVSAYLSEGWTLEDYKKANEKFRSNKITPIAKGHVRPGMYKNLTWRLRIYQMTPQFSTINKFDFLAIIKDYVQDYYGEADPGGTDIRLNFSIVGENPPNEEHLMTKQMELKDLLWDKRSDLVHHKDNYKTIFGQANDAINKATGKLVSKAAGFVFKGVNKLLKRKKKTTNKEVLKSAKFNSFAARMKVDSKNLYKK